MKKRKNNRGHLNFDARNSDYNIYATSADNADERHDFFLKTLIIVSILLLSLLLILFLPLSDNPASTPAFKEEQDQGDQNPQNNNNEESHPYATVPSKESYIPIGNGTGLGGLDLSSDFAILVNLSDMTVEARKDADDLIYPASMTKVMTVAVACDLITNLDDEYLLTSQVLNQMPNGASSAWLRDYIGQTVTVEDLLYGISYRSGADAVLCLLDYLDISLDEFVALMNKKVSELGLTNTHFGGAIGMDTENNTTTCREMAAIMAYAMDNPLCRELFGGEKHKLKYIDMTYYHSTIVTTLDKMSLKSDTLVSNYTMLAAKSGLEDNAGYCLASYIKNDKTGECFVLVTALAKDDNTNPIKDLIKIFKAINP